MKNKEKIINNNNNDKEFNELIIYLNEIVINLSNNSNNFETLNELKKFLNLNINNTNKLHKIFKAINYLIFNNNNINKDPFILFPIIYSTNPKITKNYLNYFFDILNINNNKIYFNINNKSNQNKNILSFISQFFGEILNSFFHNNFVQSSFLLEKNEKDFVYEKLLKFCINKLKISNYFDQYSGCLFLTEIIEKIPLIKEKNYLKNLFEILTVYIDDKWFIAKNELLNCLISLIFLTEENFKPFAKVTLFKILDYLTDNDWMKRKLSLNIIYTLIFYCRNEIIPLKENIIEFLNVLKNDNVKDIKDVCFQIIELFNNYSINNSPKIKKKYSKVVIKNSFNSSFAETKRTNNSSEISNNTRNNNNINSKKNIKHKRIYSSENLNKKNKFYCNNNINNNNKNSIKNKFNSSMKNFNNNKIKLNNSIDSKLNSNSKNIKKNNSLLSQNNNKNKKKNNKNKINKLKYNLLNDISKIKIENNKDKQKINNKFNNLNNNILTLSDSLFISLKTIDNCNLNNNLNNNNLNNNNNDNLLIQKLIENIEKLNNNQNKIINDFNELKIKINNDFNIFNEKITDLEKKYNDNDNNNKINNIKFILDEFDKKNYNKSIELSFENNENFIIILNKINENNNIINNINKNKIEAILNKINLILIKENNIEIILKFLENLFKIKNNNKKIKNNTKNNLLEILQNILKNKNKFKFKKEIYKKIDNLIKIINDNYYF